MNSREMPLNEHLAELRKTLLVSGAAVAACSLIAFFAFGEQMLASVTRPLLELQVPVIATRVGEAFFTRVKISLLAGFVLAFPVLAAQVIGFVLPALTRREKVMVFVLFPLSVFLFAGGVAFAYFTVFPLVLRFLLVLAAGGLQPMITVREYTSFLLAFFLPFGLVFQLPLASFVLARIGLITPGLLVKKRKYALLLIFILAALLTPGADVISQLLLAGPMVVLYEVSILVSRAVYRLRPIPGSIEM